MRTRIFDEATTTRSYRMRYSFPTQNRVIFDRQELLTRVTRKHSMKDVVTPGFSMLRNKGIIINNPMLHEEIYHDIDYTVCAMEGRDYGVKALYDLITPAGLQVAPVASVMDAEMWTEFAKFDRFTDLAITRAHANVNLSEMAILASIGELPETIRWIRSIIKRIGNLTRTLRGKIESRADLRALQCTVEEAKKLKDIKTLEHYARIHSSRKLNRKDSGIVAIATNLWLEYRYAVRPLIADLQNAIKALDKAIKSERLTARGREYHVGESSSTFHTEPNAESKYFRVDSVITTSEIIKARAGCLYIVDAQLATFLDVLGFDQPIESLYELIPFSFILDWVFSIGDLLESWFKSSGLSILTSWVTLQVESTRKHKVVFAEYISTNPRYVWPNQQLELGTSNQTVKRRWRLPNPNMPLLPRFDLKLDLAKIIDLGAILRSSIGGRIPEVAKRG